MAKIAHSTQRYWTLRKSKLGKMLTRKSRALAVESFFIIDDELRKKIRHDSSVIFDQLLYNNRLAIKVADETFKIPCKFKGVKDQVVLDMLIENQIEIERGLLSAEIERDEFIDSDDAGERASISFEVSSCVTHQDIIIKKRDIREDAIIEGLQDGSLITSTLHEKGSRSYIVDADKHNIVAEIVSQELEGDIDNYR